MEHRDRDGRGGDELFEEDGPADLHRIGWIWAVYALLFAMSIPWYLRDPTPRLWAGLPHWVVLSLIAVLGIALFTAFVAWRYWPAVEPEGDATGGEGR